MGDEAVPSSFEIGLGHTKVTALRSVLFVQFHTGKHATVKRGTAEFGKCREFFLILPACLIKADSEFLLHRPNQSLLFFENFLFSTVESETRDPHDHKLKQVKSISGKEAAVRSFLILSPLPSALDLAEASSLALALFYKRSSYCRLFHPSSLLQVFFFHLPLMTAGR